jgi:amidophosphoribosyltransferase
MGLIRSHYVGRTFIEPAQSIRHFGVRLKLNPVRGQVLQGRRVVVVDDSIVRGTTARKIVKMLRDAGRARCTCASLRRPRAGRASTASTRPTDASSSRRATRSKRSAATSPADSLAYLSIDGLRRAVGAEANTGAGFCEACFSGEYPVEIIPAERLAMPRG